MVVILYDESIALLDTNFNFECYKPACITNILGILSEDVANGAIDFKLDNGDDLYITWDVADYPHAEFNLNKLQIIKKLTKGVRAMHIALDGIQFDSERHGDICYVHVIDQYNRDNKATLIIDSSGCVRVQESTFSVNGKRKWQMLYFAEKNKSLLYSGD